MSVKELVDLAPLLLQCVAPGFAFLSIYAFFRSIELSENKMLLISITISSVISGVLHIAGDFSQWGVTVLSFIIAIFTAILLSKVTDTGLAKKVLRLIGRKTSNKYIWKDVVDFQQGTMVLATLTEDYGYLGFFLAIEENGADSWLAISEWSKVRLDEAGTPMVINEPDDAEIKSSILLRLSDVKDLKLFYDKSTKVHLS